MVQENNPREVNLESHLDSDKLSYDDLAMALEEMFEKYKLMKNKLKKEIFL